MKAKRGPEKLQKQAMQGRVNSDSDTLHVNAQSKHKHRIERKDSGARENSSVLSHLPSTHSSLGLMPGRMEDGLEEGGRKEMSKR